MHDGADEEHLAPEDLGRVHCDGGSGSPLSTGASPNGWRAGAGIQQRRNRMGYKLQAGPSATTSGRRYSAGRSGCASKSACSIAATESTSRAKAPQLRQVRPVLGDAAASEISRNTPQKNLSASVSGVTRGWLRSSHALALAASARVSRAYWSPASTARANGWGRLSVV
jgi:hypothetical protein